MPWHHKKEGNNKPDVVAPGVDINMFDDSGRQITQSGTSFATPLTAGVAALIAQKHPDYSAMQIQESIKDGADSKVLPHGENYNTEYGYGMVDASQASLASDSVKPAQSYNTMLFFIFPLVGIIIFFIPEIKKRK